MEEELYSLWEEAGGGELLSLLPGGSVPDVSPEGILSSLDGGDVLSLLSSALLESGRSLSVSLGVLCGILLLSALWKQYRDAGNAGGTGELVSYLCTASAALTAVGVLRTVSEAVFSVGERITAAMTAAVTAMTALGAMQGRMTHAGVMSTGLGLFLTFSQSVTQKVLLPLVGVCAGITVSSVLSDGLHLEKLSSLLQKTFLWCMGGVMAVFGAVLSSQSVLASGADSLSLRSVKFVLGSAVPFIGSAVGEAAGVVGTGFSVLRKSAGILGVGLVLIELLPPLCTVFLSKLLFSAAGAFGEILGLDKEPGFLKEAETLTGFLCAVMTAEGVFYILLLALCMAGQ